LYTFVFRSSPYPALTTFDVPRPDVTCTRRIRSNTPLQALTLANGQVSFEMAQGLAKRVLSEGGHADDVGRMRRAFSLCLARSPQAGELEGLVKFLKDQEAVFAADKDGAAKVSPKDLKGVEPAKAAAWVAVARVLLNLDEFITRE
jgi:hypothetical protein